MNGLDTAPLVVTSGSGQGDTQVVETIVSLNTELEVTVRYPQPRRPTPTAVAERQRPSLPEPSDLDLGKECHQLATRSDSENVCWLRGKKRSNSRR